MPSCRYSEFVQCFFFFQFIFNAISKLFHWIVVVVVFECCSLTNAIWREIEEGENRTERKNLSHSMSIALIEFQWCNVFHRQHFEHFVFIVVKSISRFYVTFSFLWFTLSHSIHKTPISHHFNVHVSIR